MADYGQRYLIQFTNRQEDACEVIISSKDDYAGYPIPLEGSEHPFTLSSQAQDNQIPYGICATEAVIEFYTGGIVSLVDFYNEADDFWLVQFYYRGNLTWTGYLQLDNSQGRVTDQNYVLSLNANDGLGRLQAKYLLNADGTPIQNNWTLLTLLSYIFAFIPSLDTKAWLNIFENSTDDRDDTGYLTFLPQTAFNTRYFTNDDGTTQSLYDILDGILKAFRSCLRQADGAWQIIRWGDIRIFDDGAMPGTLYQNGFGSYSEIFFPESITIGKSQPIFPLNENQTDSILRPLKFVKETFNYNQPPWIDQANLQIDKDATPFNSTTIGDFRYDDYTLATYFPTWSAFGDVTSYLEIVTDITATPQQEVDRYIVTPCCASTQSAVVVNPIPVTGGDTFDLSIGWRTDTDTDDILEFDLGATLITQTEFYVLANAIASLPAPLQWVGPFAIGSYTDGEGLANLFMRVDSPADVDTTQWMNFSLANYVDVGQTLPPIPLDGMLLIKVAGTNGNTAINTQGTFWKDLTLTFNSFVNSSTQIIGQAHTNSQDPEIKNDLEYDTELDDSPRSNIRGTLFTDEITTFAAGIGGVFFTRTSAWHRQGIDEERRLGDLNTFTDMFNQLVIRTIVQGDFFGLRDFSMMSLINLRWLSGKKFIVGIATIDYMSCIWNATLYQIIEEGESEFITGTVVLDTNADEITYASTGESFAISFSDIVVNTAFTPDGGFINWTYDDPTQLIGLEVNINGLWNSTASATLNLKVNGIIVGSFFIGTGGAFHFFTANIQVSPTLNTNDVVSVTMNWIGSAVYSLTVNTGSYLRATQDTRIGTYLFNYIYQTN